MYTVELPAIIKFHAVEDARAIAKALELLLAGADVHAGHAIIRNDATGSLVPVARPKVDRSKYVTGGQAARDILDKLVDGITASAYRQLPADLFEPAYAHAKATGQVDQALLLNLVQQELYPERAEAVEFLDSIVARAAAEQASREFKRATAVKKQR